MYFHLQLVLFWNEVLVVGIHAGLVLVHVALHLLRSDGSGPGSMAKVARRSAWRGPTRWRRAAAARCRGPAGPMHGSADGSPGQALASLAHRPTTNMATEPFLGKWKVRTIFQQLAHAHENTYDPNSRYVQLPLQV
jgi:hypothetical protein